MGFEEDLAALALQGYLHPQLCTVRSRLASWDFNFNSQYSGTQLSNAQPEMLIGPKLIEMNVLQVVHILTLNKVSHECEDNINMKR